MKRERVEDILQGRVAIGSEIEVAGWVRTLRESKSGLAFLHMTDGSFVPPLQVLAGFVLMHLIGGIILSVTFQLAHSVEETDYPLPDNAGVLEHDWAVHQLHTTVNFSPKNKFLTWYMGGLNFQVEHHLFPKISHVHYPKIARIVRDTASEFNIPYLEHRSFTHALRSHFNHLKTLGHVPAIDEIMG